MIGNNKQLCNVLADSFDKVADDMLKKHSYEYRGTQVFPGAYTERLLLLRDIAGAFRLASQHEETEK